MIVWPDIDLPPINLITIGCIMDKVTEAPEDESMGDEYGFVPEFGALPNDGYLQGQKDPRFNIALARKEHKERMRLKDLEVEMNYYGIIV